MRRLAGRLLGAHRGRWETSNRDVHKWRLILEVELFTASTVYIKRPTMLWHLGAMGVNWPSGRLPHPTSFSGGTVSSHGAFIVHKNVISRAFTKSRRAPRIGPASNRALQPKGVKMAASIWPGVRKWRQREPSMRPCSPWAFYCYASRLWPRRTRTPTFN